MKKVLRFCCFVRTAMIRCFLLCFYTKRLWNMTVHSVHLRMSSDFIVLTCVNWEGSYSLFAFVIQKKSIYYNASWVASHCLSCPQPLAQRQWLFHEQMVHTNYTASNGSPLLLMQIWLSRWPECRTKQVQPHRYNSLLTPSLHYHQSSLSFNDLQSDVIKQYVYLSLSHRVAGVYLYSMQRWVEMRTAGLEV